jgi:hypothetical protein
VAVQKRLGRSLVAAAGVLALAASASPAYAKSCGGGAPPTSGSAAVAQYVEQINTATGSCATGYGKPQVKPLKPSVQRKLTQQGGSDASVLQQVATSSTYGAPQSTLVQRATTTRASGKTSARHRRRAPRAGTGAASGSRVKIPEVKSNPTPSRALSAAANVVADGSNGRLIGLALFLVAITLVALGAATFRQRMHRGD